MKYESVVRCGGIYDLVLVAPLAIPGAVPWFLGMLEPLNRSLGGVGFPAFEGLPLLFVQLMGSIIVTWALLRILWPRWQLGVADAASRGLFSVHYAVLLASGGHPLVWILLVPEVLWGLVQAAGAALYRKA